MDAEDAGRWQALFRAIPQDASLPSEVADAIIAHLKEGETYYVESIARRLGSAFGVEPLIELSKVSTEFEATIRPVLGELGRRESLEKLLADLQPALAAGEKPDSDELTWLLSLDGDPAWLEPLFECLFLAYTTKSERREISDPVSPLTVAIQHVGVAAPDAVVTGYEGLFSPGRSLSVATSQPRRLRRDHSRFSWDEGRSGGSRSGRVAVHAGSFSSRLTIAVGFTPVRAATSQLAYSGRGFRHLRALTSAAGTAAALRGGDTRPSARACDSPECWIPMKGYPIRCPCS
jgi:hypothetical protein